MEKISIFLRPFWRKLVLIFLLTTVTYISFSQTILHLNKPTEAVEVGKTTSDLGVVPSSSEEEKFFQEGKTEPGYNASSVTQDGALFSYPYTKGKIGFPKDEGRHPDFDIEWWYSNFFIRDLNAPGTNKFRGFVAIIQKKTGGAMMVGLTDVQNKRSWSKTYQGAITYGDNTAHLSPSKPHDITFRGSGGNILARWYQEGEAFRYVMKAFLPEFSATINTYPAKLPITEGEDGLVRIADSISSYYYTLPRQNINNAKSSFAVNLFGQKYTSENIGGTSWADHQWFNLGGEIASNNSFRPGISHEWFSIQLNNKTEIVAWDIKTDTRTLKYIGVLSSTNGQIDRYNYVLKPIKYWTAINGKKYASTWNLTSTDLGINLNISTHVPNQLVQGLVFGRNLSFYEGGTLVSGTVKGELVRGFGYAEMTRTYE